MCGIFYYETVSKVSLSQLKYLQEQFVLTAHRGPDKSTFINDTTRAWGFHRLSINGMDPTADQPFYMKKCRLICNGEIYNFRHLIAEFDLEGEYKSGSDCEIIIHLYRKIGIYETLRRLDGVFGFVLYDYENDVTIVARDPIGVRSLYIGVVRHDGCYGVEHSDLVCVSLNRDHFGICVASEMKSIHSICDTIIQFPAGCYMEYSGVDSEDGSTVFKSYYEYAMICCTAQDNRLVSGSPSSRPMHYGILERQLMTLRVRYTYPPMDIHCIENGVDISINDSNTAAIETEICENIRDLFTTAVTKRLMSERPVGCLLSGGLDSSLITAIVSRELKIRSPDRTLNTYSIGLEGSVDLHWARRVAEYLGTCHHEVVISECEFLDAIRDTIYQTESYCTTTIRASVGNYLVSKYIQQQTDDVVIYCGDMSDEIFGSYRGFLKAPTDTEFKCENERMIRDVRFFDLLRSDKSISGAGLEARVPFADKAFLNYVMRIPARFKRFYDMSTTGRENGGGRIEKYLIRKAFQNDGLLPDDVLWRRKEAFSDGVSSQNGRSWIQMIKEYTNSIVSDADFNNKNHYLYKLYNPPYDKESFYYRLVFETIYDMRGETIPYYWRHPFCKDVLDPSARLLDFYVTDTVNTDNDNGDKTHLDG
jgi:asparagine synthase (glutamine-hydrolysing)